MFSLPRLLPELTYVGQPSGHMVVDIPALRDVVLQDVIFPSSSGRLRGQVQASVEERISTTHKFVLSSTYDITFN